MWAIIDDKGVIYSGNEEEMRDHFQDMSETNNYDWEGDLKLIEIHSVVR
jgi:hypothetical protein